MLFIDLTTLQTWLGRSLTAPVFKLGAENLSLLWIFQAISIFLIANLIIKGFKSLLKNRILMRFGISEGNREVIATLISLGIGTFGCIIVLQAMGLNLGSVVVIAGGLGVGIAFGIQDLTNNLISGFVLLIEGKLKVGDIIELDSILGRIKEISIRSTVIQTFRGSELIVPNTHLINNRVANWNYRESLGRIDIPVEVDYNSDPLLVTEVLLNSAFMESEVLRDPSPKVLLSGFGENGLSFELLIWVERMDHAVIIKSSVNFIIEYNLRQHNIKIATSSNNCNWSPHPIPVLAENNLQQEELKKSSSNPPTLKESLLEVSYFRDFNDLQLRSLIESGSRRYLHSGEVLIHQGKYASFFCIILSGSIEAIDENQNIGNPILSFKAGEYFGELPLLMDIPYSTTMIATAATTLFLINKEGFRYLLEDYPKLAEDIAQELTRRKEAIDKYQKHLQEMGLLEEQHLNSPVDWIRDNLSKIFKIN